MRRVRRVEDHTHILAAKNFCCFRSSVSNREHTSRRSAACLSPPLKFAGMFHTRGLTCQRSPKWYLSVCVDNFANVPHFRLCGLWWDDLSSQNLQPKFPQLSPRLNRENPSKVCVLPMALSPKLFWAFHVLLCSFLPPPQSLKHNSMQMHCAFKPAIRKSLIALNMHNKHLFIATQSYGCKIQ